MIDITNQIDPEEMPLCPLCDQPIFTYEPHQVVTAAGAKALAHEDCAREVG